MKVFKANYVFKISLGAILVFLPGYDDIINIRDKLSLLNDNKKYIPAVFILHSQVNTYEQLGIFDKVPYGCRKIVRNIFEISF